MTEDELDKRVRELMTRFDEVNLDYIRRVAQQIVTIGELSASSINMIAVMAAMNEDIARINTAIARAARQSLPQLYNLYEQAMRDVYTDPRFERALRDTPLSDGSRRALERYTEAVGRQSADTLTNLSNTTSVSATYRRLVDKGVLAVSSGLGDYNSVVRSAIRELGGNGIRVVYDSGYTRRLDSAIRQNIVDGAKQIQQHASDIISEDLGYDAKEISVHANSAPDHEPVQGRVFLNEEFIKLQNNQACVDIDGRHFPPMERAIAEWNCMHFAMGFSTKYSRRKYTNEQLLEFAENNAAGCEINGKHYTLYQARQLMRQIETEIRREKDVAVAAAEVGDEELRRECQRKINALSDQYNRVSNAAGLPQRRERMTVEGFKMVKA